MPFVKYSKLHPTQRFGRNTKNHEIREIQESKSVQLLGPPLRSSQITLSNLILHQRLLTKLHLQFNSKKS